MVFRNIINYINDNKLIIMVVCSVVFLVGVWLFCNLSKDSGTYDYTMDQIRNPDLYKNIAPPIHVSKKKDSKGETECRRVLEGLFNKKFPNERPKFMFNTDTRAPLELDMYNASEKLACEYSGIQHYKYVPFMHRNNIENFHKQQKRDELKRNICKKLGIRLIEVPYTVKINDIEKFLINELNKIGYRF